MNNKYEEKSIDDIITIFNSSLSGLNSKDVIARQKKYGKNILPKGKKVTIIDILIEQFMNPMVILLVIVGIISYIIGERLDSIFIGIVILCDALLGAYQEYGANKNAESLQELVTIKVIVLRDNKEVEIDSQNIVPGDIVLLTSGNKIPADIILLEVNNLTVNESMLTGESLGIRKELKKGTEKSFFLNMCYQGTWVMSGRGTGIVIGTGINTVLGKIAKNINETKDTKTPLTMKLEKFIKQISILLIFISVIIGLILFIKGYTVKEIFFSVVALAISAIPEGLPVVLTVALSIASKKMAKKNVIVRKLNAVESLGSCTVIASDKTGTLTMNEQTVKKIYINGHGFVNVSGQGYNDIGIIEKNDCNDLVNNLILNGMLDNEGYLEKENNIWSFHGDMMDIALLALGKKAKLDISNIDILYKMPYESVNKYSMCVYKNNNKTYMSAKGSYETLKELSTIKKEDEEEIEANYNELTSLGYRVLSIFVKEIKDDKIKVVNNLEFLGFVAFVDPIRGDAKESINVAKKAGIKILMITGDHPKTAKFIAKELNLLNSNKVVTGEDVTKAYHKGKTSLHELIKSANVYARVSPEEKLYIVNALKEMGEFVAVTGDGVNDALALKNANISVAMGSGTDVAKETSLMIIADDSFKSIVEGVKEGRIAYNNVRKVTYMLISSGFSEILLFLLAIIFNLPLPFIAVQLLWLNLVTDGIQDIALAFEKGEDNVMEKGPRNTKESIFDKLLIEETVLSGTIIAIMIFALWFILIDILKMDLILARTYVLIAMVFMQNVHVFNCRSETLSVTKIPIKNNYFVVISVVVTMILQLVVLNIPLMRNILGIAPINYLWAIFLLILTIPLLMVMEVYKLKFKK
ncbi:MAG: HAD-IC family P-type ATPase [Bacilli bacterium]